MRNAHCRAEWASGSRLAPVCGSDSIVWSAGTCDPIGRATLHSLARQDRPTVVGAQTSTREPMKTTWSRGRHNGSIKGQATVDYEGGARSARSVTGPGTHRRVPPCDGLIGPRAHTVSFLSAPQVLLRRVVPLREGACAPVNYCTSTHASNAPATSHGGVLTDLHEISERLDF
jgi:hypothetical protein